jgi:hypothetical protein
LVVLLLLHASLLVWSAFRNSVTFDESAHLPAGLSYWRFARFDIFSSTPPLPRLAGSWPALFLSPRVPEIERFSKTPPEARPFLYAETFLNENRDQYPRIFLWGRLGIIPISLLGCWLIYHWASKLYDPTAALVPTAIYALCPNIIAHGSIVGTDIPTMVAMTAALYAWWRFCKTQTWKWWIISTLLVAISMLCKQTAILLWGGMLITAWFLIPRTMTAWRRIILAYVGTAAATLVLINVGYLFQGTFRPLDEFQFTSPRFQSLQAHMPGLRLPLPAPLVEGSDMLSMEMQHGFSAYLLGEQYLGSKWYYFPIALLCKLPIATMLLFAWALASMAELIPPRRAPTDDERAILATCVFYLLFCMFLGHLNVGVKYILPLFPIAFLLLGRIGIVMKEQTAFTRAGVVTLTLALVVEVLVIAPRFMSFINIAWGGPSRAYTVINDCNIDWGQGLLDLKRWMTDHDVKRLQLCYFGMVEPSVYGIDYVPLVQNSDEPYVAVSSFFMTGMAQRLHTRDGPSGWIHIPFYRELQEKNPVAVVGGTIFIFQRADFEAAGREHTAAQNMRGM